MYDAKNPPFILLDEYIGTHTIVVRYTQGNQKDMIINGSFRATNHNYNYMDIYNDDAVYGKPVKIKMDFFKESYGYATFKGVKYPFQCDDETYSTSLTIDGFDIGDNIVKFTLEDYDPVIVIDYTVIVMPNIIVPSVILANENYNITFKSSPDFNGKLILKGMIKGSFETVNGEASIPISAKSMGVYPLSITFGNTTNNYDITVLDKNPEVQITSYYPEEVASWDWIYDWEDTDKYSIIVSADPYTLTGTTNIYVDGKKESFNGPLYFRQSPDFSAFGNHTIFIEYLGDGGFNPINKTINYTVTGHYCEINDYGEIFVSLPGDAKGKITATVDNNKTFTQTVHGEEEYKQDYTLKITGVNLGEKHLIEVKYEGENDYEFVKSQNVTLKFPMEIFAPDVTYNEDERIEIMTPKDLKKPLNITINGKEVKANKINFYDSEFWSKDPSRYVVYAISTQDLKPGLCNIVVSYSGDEKYNWQTVNATSIVTAEINYPYDAKYGENKYATINLPSDATGNLTVEVRHDDGDYETYQSVILKDGKAKVKLPTESVKVYDLNIYYDGNYDIDNATYQFTVNPNYNYPLAMSYGQSKQVRVFIDNESNSTLVFYISYYDSKLPIFELELNQENTMTVNKAFIDRALKSVMAKYIINSNHYEYGPYFLDLNPVIYSEKGTYELDSIEVYFDAKITGAQTISMHYGDSRTISLKVYDIYGKLVGKNHVVTVKIGKKTFKANTNKNGVVKFKIPNTVTPGKYTITLSYKNAKVSKKVTVKQIMSIKTVNVKKSAKKLVLTATLKKGKTPLKYKKVKFKFNGKTYNAKTNKKGIAKVTIKSNVLKKLKVGKKITYQATYLKDTVKKTVKIKK